MIFLKKGNRKTGQIWAKNMKDCIFQRTSFLFWIPKTQECTALISVLMFSLTMWFITVICCFNIRNAGTTVNNLEVFLQQQKKKEKQNYLSAASFGYNCSIPFLLL